jgi:hypothetical protein
VLVLAAVVTSSAVDAVVGITVTVVPAKLADRGGVGGANEVGAGAPVCLPYDKVNATPQPSNVVTDAVLVESEQQPPRRFGSFVPQNESEIRASFPSCPS